MLEGSRGNTFSGNRRDEWGLHILLVNIKCVTVIYSAKLMSPFSELFLEGFGSLPPLATSVDFCITTMAGTPTAAFKPFFSRLSMVLSCMRVFMYV